MKTLSLPSSRHCSHEPGREWGVRVGTVWVASPGLTGGLQSPVLPLPLSKPWFTQQQLWGHHPLAQLPLVFAAASPSPGCRVPSRLAAGEDGPYNHIGCRDPLPSPGCTHAWPSDGVSMCGPSPSTHLRTPCTACLPDCCDPLLAQPHHSTT